MGRFKNTIFKQREEFNCRMAEMFRLLKEITTSRAPKKVLVREEAMYPITKHVNSISLIRMEEEKSVKNNEVVGKNVVEPNKSDIAESPEEVDRKDEVENRTNNEPVRSTEGYLIGEKVRELVETPREEETTILKEYKEAVMDENKLLAQKAMIKWMKDRDKNTTFFHKVVKGIKHRSIIESICDETGKRFYSEDVPEQFVKHFQQFLRTESRVQPMVDCDQIFFKKLNDVEAFDMIKDVTNEEIKTSMFDIDNDKAHGSDGFTSCFLKRLAHCGNRYMCSHQGVLSYKETT
ncbi:hypothetical protein Tco_1456322 [Tanacetum coccineum]